MSTSRSSAHAERRSGSHALVATGSIVAARMTVRMPESMTMSAALGGSGTGVCASVRVSMSSALLVVGEAARQLIHDADRGADEIGLGAPRGQRQADVVQRQMERGPKRAAQRDLERSARGEPSADRDSRFDASVEPAEGAGRTPSDHVMPRT